MPASTGTYHSPPRPLVSPDGKVQTRLYLLELATIAMDVQQLDEDWAVNRSQNIPYERVISADRRLCTLKKSVPKVRTPYLILSLYLANTVVTQEWWTDEPQNWSPAPLLQHWHDALLSRIHLHAAVSNDEHNEYAYSRVTCGRACESICHRYVRIRLTLPDNFFATRTLDMQAFTGAAYLLLTFLKKEPSCDQARVSAVQSVIRVMEAVRGRNRRHRNISEASEALVALMDMALNNPATATARNLTLRIPLLGKVRIGRDTTRQEQQYLDQPSLPPSISMPDTVPAATMYQVPSNIVEQPNQSTQQQQVEYMGAQPWLTQLDLNSSMLQNSLLGEDCSEFDQWLAVNNINENMWL